MSDERRQGAPADDDSDLDRTPVTDDSLAPLLGAMMPATRVELSPGAIVDGTYRIGRRLGAGGMGVVYLARDITLHRSAAIKIYRAPRGVDRPQREAVAMAQLAHPNVVAVYGVGRIDEGIYIAMEYVPGTTLSAWLRAAPRGWREVLAVMRAAGTGLAAVHDARLVHRDFTPGNVLIGEDGRPRVSDFGLVSIAGPMAMARASVADDPTVAVDITSPGAVLGTPAYMAPEQHTGASVDARADQFAFCAVFYEALYGQRPWPDGASADRPTPPPRGRAPAWIWRVLRRGLAREPAARYADMHTLLAALRAAPRRRAIAIAALASIAVAGAIAGAVWARQPPPPDPCARAAAPVDSLWTGETQGRIADRFRAVDAREGERDARRLADRLDGWTDRWRRAAIAACAAAPRRSPALAAASQRCLHASITRLQALVARAVEAPDRAVVLDIVVDGQSRLPASDDCNDEARLAAWQAPAPHTQLVAEDGYWVGNFGRHVMREVDGEVWGVYDHDDGAVRGRMVGGTLVGWWCEVPTRAPGADAGEVEVRFATDADGHRRATGRWRYGTTGAWDPRWDLVWHPGAPPPELLARLDDPAQFCAHP